MFFLFPGENPSFACETPSLAAEHHNIPFKILFCGAFLPLCSHAPSMAGCCCGSGPCHRRAARRRAVERRPQRAAAELVARQKLRAATHGADRPYREGGDMGVMAWEWAMED